MRIYNISCIDFFKFTYLFVSCALATIYALHAWCLLPGLIMPPSSLAVPEFSFPIPFERLSHAMLILQRDVIKRRHLAYGSKAIKTAYPFWSLKPNWWNCVREIYVAGTFCQFWCQWLNGEISVWWLEILHLFSDPPYFLIFHIAKRTS